MESKQQQKQQIPKNAKYPNLNLGGTPGNKGGGNIKSEIRDLSLTTHRKLLKKLIAKADSKAEKNQLSNADLIRLLDISGKYGVGSRVEIDIPNAHFASIVTQTALEFIHPDQWDNFKAKVKQVLGGDN